MNKLSISLFVAACVLCGCKQEEVASITPSPAPSVTPSPSVSLSATDTPAPTTDPSPSDSPLPSDAPSTKTSFAGAWRIDLDRSTIPSPDDAGKAMEEAERIQLHGDGTYAITGGISPVKGKWTHSDGMVILTPDKGQKPLRLKVSADGSSLSTSTGAGPGAISVVFIRA
jgi:hypothetical protein